LHKNTPYKNPNATNSVECTIHYAVRHCEHTKIRTYLLYSN